MNIIFFTSGVIFGMIIQRLILFLIKNYQDKKLSNEIKSQFLQIIKNLKSGKSKFKTRVKDTVLLESHLEDYGVVNLIYFLDKEEISILKEEKIMFSSHSVKDKNTIKELINTIKEKFGKKINDTIEVMGIKVSREEFEKNLRIQITELKKSQQPENDVDQIIMDNSSKLDIDEILDKISKEGLESLTETELNFLRNFK